MENHQNFAGEANACGTTHDKVQFDTTDSVGIFSPQKGGGASPQPLDPLLFVDVHTPATATTAATGTHGYWIYRKSDIKLNAVGTPATEYTMVASGLQSGACQQINKTLTSSTTIPALGATELQLVGAAPLANSNNTNSSTPADLSQAPLGTTTAGLANGCYVTSNSIYVYIHTLLVL